MAIDLTKFSVTDLREINELKQELSVLRAKHSDIIEFVEGSDSLFHVLAGDHDFFTVSHPKRDGNQVNQYTIHRKPRSISDVSTYQKAFPKDSVLQSVQSWVEILNEHRKEVRKFHDPNYEQSEKEIEEAFKFQYEEGDETEAYHTTVQINMQYLLTYVKTQLQEEAVDNPAVQKLIKESTEIKESIQQLPRGAIKVMMTKFLSVLKKERPKIFAKVWEIILKKGIEFSWEKAEHWIVKWLN